MTKLKLDFTSLAGMGIFALLCVIALSFAVGAWLWTYTINTWLVYCAKAPVIAWWQGGLLTFLPVVGKLCIPAAVFTWVLMLFLM